MNYHLAYDKAIDTGASVSVIKARVVKRLGPDNAQLAEFCEFLEGRGHFRLKQRTGIDP